MKAFRYIGDSWIQIIQDMPNEARVEDLYVHPDQRGKHLGYRLMTQTCKDADREQVTLYLKPLPFGSYDAETEEFHPPTLSFKELCAFYRSFGFRFKAGSKEWMMRKPKGG